MRCVALCGLASVLVCLVVTGEARLSPAAAGCRSDRLDQASPRTKRLCTKILALWEVQRAMEDYLDEEMRGELGISGNGAKRQDVDHVFLRFGRALL